MEILKRVKPYCTDEVMEILGYNPIAEGEELRTNYGDSTYTSGLKSANSFYNEVDSTTVRVLIDGELFIEINGKEALSRYLYEFELSYIDDNWLISAIIQDSPFSVIY